MADTEQDKLFKKYSKCKFFLVGFGAPEVKHVKTYLYDKRLKDVADEKNPELAWEKVDLSSFHFVLINLDASGNDTFLDRLVESNRFTKTPIFSFSRSNEVYINSYAKRKMTGIFLKMPINLSEFEKELTAVMENGGFERNQINGMSQTMEHYTKGCTAYLADDLETAKEEIRLSLKEDPSNIDAYMKMGEILIDMEDYGAALRVLKAAAQLDPKNARVLYLLGILDLQVEKFDDARRTLNSGVELEPDNVQYIMDIGNKYMDLNMIDDALHFFNMAKTKAPEFLYIYNRIGIALSRAGRFDEAEQEYGKALEIDDKDAGIYFNMGMLECRRDNKEKAAEHFKKTLAIDAGLVEAKQMLEKISA
ncbi:MAG: tetratricopeptide repeat protein [Nitrospinota bacterium]